MIPECQQNIIGERSADIHYYNHLYSIINSIYKINHVFFMYNAFLTIFGEIS